jgi:uncharacterized small protein (DUF1192 family)
MSCECYKIGGRFIAEDPDCPAHGTVAQMERDQEQLEHAEMEDRIASLESEVQTQQALIEKLSEVLSILLGALT